MSTAHPLPPAAVVISHEVADWAAWKTRFDGDEGARRAAGMLGHHVNRGRDNPNSLSIYFALSDVEKAKAFAAAPALKEVMAAAGVISAPHAVWMTPVVEHLVWDRELPALLITHTVADFATWLDGYHSAEPVRHAAGIIGHAVNQSVDDPSTAVVYHQAESFDALQALAGSADLKAAMQKAGVTSAPVFTFVTGGWAKNY